MDLGGTRFYLEGLSFSSPQDPYAPFQKLPKYQRARGPGGDTDIVFRGTCTWRSSGNILKKTGNLTQHATW